MEEEERDKPGECEGCGSVGLEWVEGVAFTYYCIRPKGHDDERGHRIIVDDPDDPTGFVLSSMDLRDARPFLNQGKIRKIEDYSA